MGLIEEESCILEEDPSLGNQTVGLVILGFSILGGSSIGVFSNTLPIESPFGKNSWRAGINVVYFILPALYENIMMK